MSVRFVIGRGGAGKTAYCLDQIVSRLRESAAEGPHLFLLVPEQAAMQMERALIEAAGVEGFARCDVLSFRRLAYRVLSASGGGICRVSPTGRLMILRHLVAQHADDLVAFGASRGRRGFVEHLGRTLDELIQEEVRPEDLAESLDRIPPDDDLLAARVRDIHRIYRAYLDALGPDLADPGHDLTLVRERLADYRALVGSLIWVDGFAGLTKQEHRLLVALAGLADRMEISLLIDPDSAVVRQGAPVEPFHLFARTERTYVSLHKAMREAGIEVELPRLLRGPCPRFRDAPHLARLERDLFSVFPRPSGNRSPPVSSEACGGGIELVEAATRRIEVAAVVGEIQRLVRRPHRPMRYRDIAIIVRNLEPYHDLLSAALASAGIPYFIDRRRPIAHHALVELIRSAVALLERVDVETMGAFVKTGLAGLKNEEADLLENYLKAHGITGRSNWVRGDWSCRPRPSRSRGDEATAETSSHDLQRINDLRRRLVEELQPWWRLIDAPAPPTAGEWAVGLFDLLQRLDVPRQIAEWADRADRTGRIRESQEHRQVWAHVVELLEDLTATFGDKPMTVETLTEVVDTALSSATLGLTPPTLDQVLIGSIERSRHPPIRAAFVLGFGEGEFPQRPAEDAIFGDRDRLELARAGVELAPASRQQLFDERLLAYIALTRPSECLWVSWPASDVDGRVRRPSPYVEMIRAVFPELPVRKLADPTATRRMWAIATAEDLAAAMTVDLRTRRSPSPESPQRRARAECSTEDRRWNALYEWARQEEHAREVLRRALASLVYRNRAALSPATAGRVYAPTWRASVSQVERFAACPFQHFAAYVLRLEPPTEFELDVVDLGLIYHRVLQDYVGGLISAGQRLSDVDPKDLDHAIPRIVRQAVGELVDEMILADARNAYLLDRGNVDLIRALHAQRFVASAGTFRPVGVEVLFGFEPREVPAAVPGDERGGGRLFLPALKIDTPQGRSVLLRGRIDRIDLAEMGGKVLATVVDYKRSAERRLDLNRVFHGLDLQLPTYLLVLAEHGPQIGARPVEPAGAFYATLLDEVRRLDAPPNEPPDPTERYRQLRPCLLYTSPSPRDS